MSGEYWQCKTREQLEACFNFLRANFPATGWRVGFKPWKEVRSLSQNAFQHVIYEEISNYLMSRGRKDCTPEWVKKMLKNAYLGWEQENYTDIKTGEITVRDVLRSTSKLDVGESVYYTDQILEWAASIGCDIKIPAKCEYRDYKEAQEL